MLTDAKIKHAAPRGKPYKLSDSGGLYLEVMPSGSKYWRLKYRFAKKEKRLAIGTYPSTASCKYVTYPSPPMAGLDKSI